MDGDPLAVMAHCPLLGQNPTGPTAADNNQRRKKETKPVSFLLIISRPSSNDATAQTLPPPLSIDSA